MKSRLLLNGAQAIIATLRAYNVETIFGIPGVHTLPLYDVIRDEPGLRHILARHEQGAGFMADGYARASGRPGVVCTITGPGLTNVATPVASAYSDSIPLLVISSSLPGASAGRPRGRGALHELKNQSGVMEALAGWTRSIERVEEIPEALHDAFRAMLQGRPRGSYLQVPLDLFTETAEVEIPEPLTIEPVPPSETALAGATRLLRAARQPLIVAGAGVTLAGANQRLAQLAELLQAPVLLGSKSHDVLPTNHPLVIATSGYAITDELRSLLNQCDVALVIGSKLGAQRTNSGNLPLPSALIHVDIDPTEIGYNYPASVGVVGDARLTIEALLQALNDISPDRPEILSEVAMVRSTLAQRTRRVYGEAMSLLDSVRESLPQKSIIVADMTMLGYASAQYLSVYEPRTYIHASELCSIGCGLPMALGAKVAAPDRPVVALCGDGGFLLNVGELATAVQERIPVVTVIFNDATYTAVKNSQQRNFNGRYIATDLQAPDYVALAQAFGARGVRAEDPAALRDAIDTAIHQNKPTVIEVPLPPKQW